MIGIKGGRSTWDFLNGKKLHTIKKLARPSRDSQVRQWLWKKDQCWDPQRGEPRWWALSQSLKKLKFSQPISKSRSSHKRRKKTFLKAARSVISETTHRLTQATAQVQPGSSTNFCATFKLSEVRKEVKNYQGRPLKRKGSLSLNSCICQKMRREL